MVGIYKYKNGLVFTGIIANSEQEAWAYLDKKINETPLMYRGEKLESTSRKASRTAFVIKEVTLV